MRTVTTRRDLEQLHQSGKPVILKFEAAWCAPCRAAAPAFNQAAALLPNVVFAVCDVDRSRDLVVSLGVRSVPTYMAWRPGGRLANVLHGSTGLDELLRVGGEIQQG